jgi:xylulokinase
MVIGAMEAVLGKPFDILRLSGGGSKSDLWNHIQADIYGRTVERLRVSECTTLGATILGAAGCGVFSSVEEGVSQMVHPFDKIEPDPKNSDIYGEELEIYRDGFYALKNSGVYERLTAFQKKHWG